MPGLLRPVPGKEGRAVASRIRSIPPRPWLQRNLGWIAAAALVAAVALLSSTPAVMGSAPPNHKIVICHATPPETAANGWNMIEVDVASVGYQHAGHESRHDADIIPPYTYGGASFPGKNWTTLGQAIWDNDCRAVAPTVAPTAVPTVTPTVAPTPTPTGDVAPTQGPNPTPTGDVQPATGTPSVTLPPTDMVGVPRGAASPVALTAIGLVLATTSLVALSLDHRRRRHSR
jgi:hypothetical protein